MIGSRPLIVAGALLLSLAGAGHAADYSTLPPPASYMPVAPVYVARNPFMSGWYLRGDLGAHWGLITSAQSASPVPDPTENHLDSTLTASLGVGFKSTWLRTDVTIDYAGPAGYRGSIFNAGDTTAKIQATTALFNGYLDLGTWYHVTPYIGGGVGAAYARVSDYSSPAPPFSDGDKNQWNFAWAGMVGFAIPVSDNLMMDVGYRYLNIGNLTTGSDQFGEMKFKNVAAHELRAGLRWSFDDLRILR